MPIKTILPAVVLVATASVVPACSEQAPTAAAVRRPLNRRERLLAKFDLSHPLIEVEQIMAGGPDKDGIPALVDPRHVPASTSPYPPDDGRVVAVAVGKEAVAYPLGIMNFHEIANDTVDGVPIAAVYCPLCDSVSVLDRRLRATDEAGNHSTSVVEFGVSGLLYNSNVLMYERHTTGLWSQVYMRAVTGPRSGVQLAHLPVRMMSFAAFKKAYPRGEVLSTDTGHDRPYDVNPYEQYFRSDQTFRGLEIGGEALPPKTLGLGVRAGDWTAFVAAAAVRAAPYTLSTPAGDLLISGSAAGLSAETVPAGVAVMQTYYHAWSAFNPGTRVIATAAGEAGAGDTTGAAGADGADSDAP